MDLAFRMLRQTIDDPRLEEAVGRLVDALHLPDEQLRRRHPVMFARSFGECPLLPEHVLRQRDALPLLPMVLATLIAPPVDHHAREGLRAFYVEQAHRPRGSPIYQLFLAFGTKWD